MGPHRQEAGGGKDSCGPHPALAHQKHAEEQHRQAGGHPTLLVFGVRAHRCNVNQVPNFILQFFLLSCKSYRTVLRKK